MKKLTAAEVVAFQQLNPPHTRSKERPEYAREANRLEVGEGIFITKEEWGVNKKSNPASSLGYYYPEKKFSYQTTPSGWLITRVA